MHRSPAIVFVCFAHTAAESDGLRLTIILILHSFETQWRDARVQSAAAIAHARTAVQQYSELCAAADREANALTGLHSATRQILPAIANETQQIAAHIGVYITEWISTLLSSLSIEFDLFGSSLFQTKQNHFGSARLRSNIFSALCWLSVGACLSRPPMPLPYLCF